MIYKRMIPMAQSKYILVTYSRKLDRVNKYRILSYLILATYSQKPGGIISLIGLQPCITFHKRKKLKKTVKSKQQKTKAFIGRQAKVSSSMKLALGTGRYALSVSRPSLNQSTF